MGRIGRTIGTVSLLAVVLGLLPAVAWAAPAFQLPFACGSGPWHLSSYDTATSPTGQTYQHEHSVDINGAGFNEEGQPVLASADGSITFLGGTSNVVEVAHGDGWTTRYLHMTNPTKSGQAVAGETVLGYVGSEGPTSGAHLHYEQQRHGASQHPVFDGQPVQWGPGSTETGGGWTFTNSREATSTQRSNNCPAPPAEPDPPAAPLDDAPSRSTATRAVDMGNGYVAFLGITPDGTLFTRFWSSGGGWGPYTVQGREASWSRAAVPAITRMADGRLVLAAIKASGEGYTRVWTQSGGWGEFVQFGTQTWSARGGVALQGRPDGLVTLMAVKDGGQVYRANSADGHFVDFAEFGAGAWSPLAAPALTVDRDGNLHAALLKADGRLFTNIGVIGQGWGDFVQHGDDRGWPTTGGPALIGRPDGIVTVAAVDLGGALRTANRSPAGEWGGLATRGVDPSWSRSVPPALTVDREGRIWLAALKADGSLYSVIGTPGEGYGDFRRHGDGPTWTARGVLSFATASDGSIVMGMVNAGGPLRSRIISPAEQYQPAIDQDPALGPTDPVGLLPGQTDQPDPGTDPEGGETPGTPPPGTPDDSDDASPEGDRLAGASRRTTAIAIADHVFPNGAGVVYLAEEGSGLAVTLAAGTFTDGPVLLTSGTGPSDADVEAAVRRMDPDQVVALGASSGGISTAMLDAVAQGRPTARISGSDVYGTAAAIALAAWPGGADVVYVAESVRLADGLAGGVLRDGPILLVPSVGAVPSAVRDAVEELDPSRVVALGGPAAVAGAVLTEIASGRPTDRLEGASRFETAAAVASVAFPSGASTVYLARQDIAPDAVVAGSVTDGPILLVESCNGVHPATAELIRGLNPQRVVALGGTAAICDATLEATVGG